MTAAEKNKIGDPPDPFDAWVGPSPDALELGDAVNRDLFEFFSPRLQRDVRIVGRHRFDYALLCEADPAVVSYCPHPGPAFEFVTRTGRKDNYMAAFWIRFATGTERFFAIEQFDKLKSYPESVDPKPVNWYSMLDVENQLGVTISIVLDTELEERRTLIQNAHTALPLATRASRSQRRDLVDNLIERFDRKAAFTLAEAANSFPGKESETVIGTVLCMAFRGLWSIDIDTGSIGRHSIVRPEPHRSVANPTLPEA